MRRTGGSTKLAEGTSPDLFHAIPVGYDTTFDGVIEGQLIALGLGFVALSEVSEQALPNGHGYAPGVVELRSCTHHDVWIPVVRTNDDKPYVTLDRGSRSESNGNTTLGAS